MKVISKKKAKTLDEAKDYFVKKLGLQPDMLELRKEHKTRWMFRVNKDPQRQQPNDEQSWHDFLKQFKQNNPDMPHGDARKAASEVWKAKKEAA